eukprot:GEZU01042981.1.p1 GENE.GEZU01042981.1~~GEZU01042981.1.p1  ORF type:complete len:137 (+),score=44.45 GEZU01042981.1:104-514(+)
MPFRKIISLCVFGCCIHKIAKFRTRNHERKMSGAMKKFIPLLDRVLIKRMVAKEKTVGGILLPDAGQKKLNEGVVIAVGPGLKTKTGEIIPVSVKPGQNVLLPEYGGTNVTLGKEEYVLYRDEDILGIIEDGENKQ